MNRTHFAILILSIVFASATYGANPFLDAANEKPVSARFRGTEWGEGLTDKSPLTARVVTTRVATMAWGAIFKMEFLDIKSKGAKKLKIRPDYYIVTDEQIILLNEEDSDAAAKKIEKMAAPPPFEPGNVYGITKGVTTHKDGPWETEIEVKGDICTYLSSHNSGHFTKRVWKKGVGLIEHASGYGAMAYGHRLKRAK